MDTDLDSYGDNSLGTDGDQCPEVPGVANGEGGNGCPAAITDADGDGVDDSIDDCPETPAGVPVGQNGCEVTEPTDNNTTGGNGNETTDGEGNTTLPVNGTDGDGEGDGDETPGEPDLDGDATNTQSDSEIFGMPPMLIYGAAGLVVIALLSMLLLRGRNSGPTSAFAQQEKAYDAGAMPAVDPTITAEQLAYEQQLVASGYPADYARAYADQHFRPWLQN